MNMKLINMICTYKNNDECGGKWRKIPRQYTGAALPPLRLSSPLIRNIAPGFGIEHLGATHFGAELLTQLPHEKPTNNCKGSGKTKKF
jgi:hypothetical protein